MDPIIELAMQMYESYGNHTGHLNYAGLPMPRWEDLSEKIQGAWMASARTAVDYTVRAITVKLVGGLNEQV